MATTRSPAPTDETSRAPARTVLVQARTVVLVLAIGLAFVLALLMIYAARRVLVWAIIAAFLALALNPAVAFFEKRGLNRAGAAGLVMLLSLLVIAGIGFILIPPLVDQVRDFVDAAPKLVSDLTHGRGRLGFLERDYHIVERVRTALKGSGGAGALGATKPLVNIVTSFVTFVVATLTILFLTLFMLIEGPSWVARFEQWVPERARPHWTRSLDGIYRTIGGYVTGNLLISLIAGVSTTVVLLIVGVPYAVALGVIVAVLDLIPLAGATIAAVIVGLVAFVHAVIAGIVVVAFFVAYQQLENHVLQPLVYGRTVQLSPLAVLLSVLVGAEVFGVIGALAAIPVGGSAQVIAREVWQYRRDRRQNGATLAPPV
jgi:predicted PurR-regulated permease PerM